MSDLDALLNATSAPLLGSSDLDALLGLPTPTEPTTPPTAAAEPEINDPFADVDRTVPLEQQVEQELTAAQAAFRDRSKTYKKQRLLAEDSEFWVAVCFRSREDKEAFLRKHDLIHLGDKYLSGYAVDAALTKEP